MTESEGSKTSEAMLYKINDPSDLRKLNHQQLSSLCGEIRQFIVDKVSRTGGHLGSNLGAVELTVALHRVFESPKDVLLWDTGHQAYIHKLLTGRRSNFDQLRQEGGMSGYPNRAESDHDWIENSHASTVLGYAQGLAKATAASNKPEDRNRRIVAVLGDGSMTGGMAYEGLNNLGHSKSRVLIVLNDNGRSYAPTVSRLSSGLSKLRAKPQYMSARNEIEKRIKGLPGGNLAAAGLKGMKTAVREVIEPTAFFETLGVRYIGPIDGHDIAGMEQALRDANTYDGPIVVHVITQKGRGYAPAEDDAEKCLHDVKVFDPIAGPTTAKGGDYTEAFSRALLSCASRDDRLHAITAAMAGPTGLLPFQQRYPERFTDVGIAEQHAVTMAAGMAMGGLRPVICLYSTFFTRAIDQAMYDVGLHNLPVIFALDRAGITGEDGESHNGVFDMALCQRIPGITMFAPSSAQELHVMMLTALTIEGPVAIRYARGAARQVPLDDVGSDLRARKVRDGNHACVIAVGKTLEAAENAAELLASQGINIEIWDPRVVKPLDSEMLADAATHSLVFTVEDGVAVGGVGSSIANALSTMDSSARVVQMGTPDAFLKPGKPDAVAARCGIDPEGIATTIRQTIESHLSA